MGNDKNRAIFDHDSLDYYIYYDVYDYLKNIEYSKKEFTLLSKKASQEKREVTHFANMINFYFYPDGSIKIEDDCGISDDMLISLDELLARFEEAKRNPKDH